MKDPVDILLVEDNPNDVELALLAFRRHELAERVAVVRDGQEALDFMFATGDFGHRDVKSRPRVVLLDLKLPKVDGLDVLRQIKADERTRCTPVVVLTSSREGRDVSRAYHLGANSYIVKPVEFDKFLDVSKQLGAYWIGVNETHDEE